MNKSIAPVRIIVEEIKERAGPIREIEVKISANYREDLVALYPKQSRYLGFGKRWIPINEWHSFIDKAKNLPQTKIIYFNKELELALELYQEKKDWNIKLDKSSFRISRDKSRTSHWTIANIPGLSYENVGDYYKLPIPEGWRLFDALKDESSVSYTEDALKLIEKQINQRQQIEQIATAKDWEYDVTFANSDFHLRPYQKVAAAFAEAVSNRALISYDMGLGKTWIAIAPTIKNKWRTLVICPASLKHKWCKEIDKLTGIKPIVLFNTQPQPTDTIEFLVKKSSQYYVCNYETISRGFLHKKEWTDDDGQRHVKEEKRFLWIDLINIADFDLIIVDESHYTKNTDSARSQAISRLKFKGMYQLTGTPVLNRAGEYFPTLHLLRPDLFPSEAAYLAQYTDGRGNPKNTEQFKEILKTVMIRRRQQDVRDEVPEKNVIPRYLDISSKALKAYRRIEQGVYDLIQEYESDRSNFKSGAVSVTSILAKIQRLKMVCAIDKAERTADLATELHYNAIQNERKHNKILIFSQYKGTARAINNLLGHESLCTVDRDLNSMNTMERENLIDEFQSESKYKYLVTTLAAKEGHDITEAGMVIFNDLFWTPAAHEQCEGRAYMRENDPHGIDSYYQIIDMNGDSVEEWIWELLGKKGAIINEIVDGVEGSRDVSISSALIERFKSSMHTRRR